jgi:hypothetical protein
MIVTHREGGTFASLSRMLRLAPVRGHHGGEEGGLVEKLASSLDKTPPLLLSAWRLCWPFTRSSPMSCAFNPGGYR